MKNDIGMDFLLYRIYIHTHIYIYIYIYISPEQWALTIPRCSFLAGSYHPFWYCYAVISHWKILVTSRVSSRLSKRIMISENTPSLVIANSARLLILSTFFKYLESTKTLRRLFVETTLSQST